MEGLFDRRDVRDFWRGEILERVIKVERIGVFWNGLLLFLGGCGYTDFFSPSFGGREASLEVKAKEEANQIAQDGRSIAGDAKASAEGIVGDVKQKAGELKQKVVK